VTFSVTALIAAYNEEDVIGQVVGDLAAQGIRVYLIDHGSTDATVKEVERAAGAALVGVERLDVEGFSLEAILERKAARARTLESSWFVNQDADEFRESPWTDCSFFEGVRRVDGFGYNAIDFEVLNFWPTHDRFRKGDDVRSAFTLYERGGTFDRLQVRCWKRTAGPFDLLASGGHEVAFEGRRVFPLRFLLRHYPIRSQAQGERKVFRERRPRFPAAERARGWHVQYDALQPGHRFIRDPEGLRPYDPHEVRLDLVLRHRGVEDLEAEVERLRVDIARRSREQERLDRDLEARGREVEALNRDLDVRTREKEQLDADLATRGREIDGLNRDLRDLAVTLPPLRAELEATGRDRDQARRDLEAAAHAIERLQAEAARLREHVARIEASLTWRLGAPVRSASAWLRGRA
jgi:Glycosyl transferase family 2